ncbi:MAG: hypothetical protein Q8M12_00690, partial [bacterium]|nr:hypothetical protein [bacterium]
GHKAYCKGRGILLLIGALAMFALWLIGLAAQARAIGRALVHVPERLQRCRSFRGALVAGRTGTSHDSLSKKGRNYCVCGAWKYGLGGENMRERVRLRLELIFYLLHLSPATYHVPRGAACVSHFRLRKRLAGLVRHDVYGEGLGLQVTVAFHDQPISGWGYIAGQLGNDFLFATLFDSKTLIAQQYLQGLRAEGGAANNHLVIIRSDADADDNGRRCVAAPTGSPPTGSHN